MAVEQYSNLASTTLGANYTAGSGALQVASTAGNFPTSPQFHVYVADSATGVVKVILKVTAITDATHFAVTAEGADANAVSGDVVKLSLTAGAMDQIRLDLHQTGALASAASNRAGNLYLPNDGLQIYRDSGSAMVPWGPIWPLTNPNLKSWTQQDFGSCTSNTTHGGISIDNPTSESPYHIHALVTPIPATPYHLEMCFLRIMAPTGGDVMAGACFTDGTKYEIFDQFFQNSLSQAVVQYMSNSTSFAGTELNANPGQPLPIHLIWARLGDDGTNKTFDISYDGFTWIQLKTETNTTNLTATKAGFYLNNGPSHIRLLHYKETA